MNSRYSGNVEGFRNNIFFFFFFFFFFLVKCNCWARRALPSFMRPYINSASYEYKNKSASNEAQLVPIGMLSVVDC